MPWFRCMIEGENFPGHLIQQDGLYGFWAARVVEAASAEDAELRALEVLRADPTFALGDRPKAAEAKIYFAEIEEVEGPMGPTSGATWFRMEEDNGETL